MCCSHQKDKRLPREILNYARMDTTTEKHNRKNLNLPFMLPYFFSLAEARADASRCQSFWEEDERSGFMGSFKGGAGGEGGLSQTACC